MGFAGWLLFFPRRGLTGTTYRHRLDKTCCIGLVPWVSGIACCKILAASASVLLICCWEFGRGGGGGGASDAVLPELPLEVPFPGRSLSSFKPALQSGDLWYLLPHILQRKAFSSLEKPCQLCSNVQSEPFLHPPDWV